MASGVPTPSITQYGLVDHRHENPIGHESRIVVHLHGRLAECLRQRHDALRGLITCGEATNHFYQLHDRHRIHEVHADHEVGTLGLGSDLGNGDRTGIGGENGARRSQTIKVLEDAEFEIGAFGGRLHHQVGIRRGIERDGGGDAIERGMCIVDAERALLHLSIEVLPDRVLAALEGLGADVDHRDVVAIGGEHVCYAVSHLARANNRHDLHRIAHGATP